MGILWGTVVLLVALVAWLGQTVVWFAPATGVRLGLCEAEADVEPTYWADIRGEALWDALTGWVLAAAGVLLIVDNPAWAYFGLVGGGTYFYFAGRGIITRLVMQRRGLRIGAPSSVRVGYAALVVWGLVALVTIIAAVVALPTS